MSKHQSAPSSSRPWIKWLWIAALITLIDQVTKYAALRYLTFGDSLQLTPFLNLRLTINTGAAYGFLHQAGSWHLILFVLIAVIAIIALLYWLLRLPAKERLTSIAICLVIGGALGNLIDRLHHGFVIDFIDFHIKHWHFATFNVADSAISIGAILLIISTLL